MVSGTCRLPSVCQFRLHCTRLFSCQFMR
jgi:hypothetical protein